MKELEAASAKESASPNPMLKDHPFDVSDLEHTDELLRPCDREKRQKIESYMGDRLRMGWYLLGCRPEGEVVLVGDADMLGYSPHRSEHDRFKLIRLSIWLNGTQNIEYFESRYSEIANGLSWMRSVSPSPRKNKDVLIPEGYDAYWIETPNGDIMGGAVDAVAFDKSGYCDIGASVFSYPDTRCWIIYRNGLIAIRIPNRIQSRLSDVAQIGRDVIDNLYLMPRS